MALRPVSELGLVDLTDLASREDQTTATDQAPERVLKNRDQAPERVPKNHQ